MIVAARRALFVLSAVIAASFICLEQKREAESRIYLPATVNRDAKMKYSFDGFGENVSVFRLAPNKEIPILDRGFFNFFFWNENSTQLDRLSGRYSDRWMIGWVIDWFCEIRLTVVREPFCGYPTFDVSCWRDSIITEYSSNCGSFVVSNLLAGCVSPDRANRLKLVNAEVGPELNPVSFKLFGNGFVGGVQEISAYASSDSQNYGADPKNYSPDRYRPFISSSVIIIACASGFWGLRWSLRQGKPLPFVFSLILCAAFGWVAAWLW